MSRMFPWERWPTILIGYICILLPDLIMASIHTVSSTCGREFFLPSLPQFDSFSLVGWVEVVACDDVNQPVTPLTVTMCTTSNDVVHTLSVSSNESAHIDVTSLMRKDASLEKYGLRISTSAKSSAYAHLGSGSDVMTIIPFDAIANSYLVPDLRTSDFEEQRVYFYNIYSRTNITVTTHAYTDYDTLWSEGGTEESSSDGSSYSVKSEGGDGGSKATVTSVSDGGAGSASLSTTTIKATPTSINHTNTNSSSSSSSSQYNSSSDNHLYPNNNSNNSSSSGSSGSSSSASNITTSVFFLSSALQTRSLFVESDTAVFLRATKPVGVLVLVSLSSSYSSSPSSFETSSSSWAADDVTRGGDVGGVGVGGGEGDEAEVTLEMVVPSSSLGKYFYLPVLDGFSDVKLLVAGQENAALDVHWSLDNSSQATSHDLPSPHSLLLEQPIKNPVSHGHVRIASTSPVLVYVVIEMCGNLPGSSSASSGGSTDPVTSSDARCDVNAFFLPPVEQYFRCAADVGENTCDTVCPSFWNSGDCALQRDASGNRSSELTEALNSVVIPSSSSSSTVTGESRTWHVHHALNGTHFNVTDACVLANATYLPFRLDLASGSFLPAGTRLAKLYSACVPNISAQGGEGDGADNDCDGLVDEEEENMKDDDGDDRVDEDTFSDCANGASSRAARSGGLQRAVAEPGPPWFFDYEEEDSEMPLLAVIISLSVAIFAVIAVISIFLLMELMSRRRQIRNTKIRPFVS